MDTTYRLEQTGKEVQEILNQVGPNKEAIENEVERSTATDEQLQQNIDDERQRAEEAEQTLQQNIDALAQQTGGAENALNEKIEAETERAQEAEQALQDNIAQERQMREQAVSQEQQRAEGAEGDLQADIDDINSKIPAEASADNQLADKNFVNSSIQTATAEFKGTYNSKGELDRVTANQNDYAYVIGTDTEGNTVYSRYKYVEGTGWVFEYNINNSSFTAQQWAAIQSGITAMLVAKLMQLPVYGDLMQLFATKQDVLHFDTTPTANSNNPVYSGGIKHALDDKQDTLTFDNEPTQYSNNPVKSGSLYDRFAAIFALIPQQASASNKLADKDFVNSSIQTNTADFKGTYNSVEELEAVTDANANDYAYVVSTDADGNTFYNRYKYVEGAGWVFEYKINNSSFTAQQWAAIQSGITALLVAKLRSLPTASDIEDALGGKQDVLDFDLVPTRGSSNPVTSNGIFNAIAQATGINFVDVEVLPTPSIDTMGKIYLLPNADNPEAKDWYVTIYNAEQDTYGWENVNTSSVDLSNYYTKEEVNNKVADKNVTVETDVVPSTSTRTYTRDGETRNHIVGDKRIVPNRESASGYDIYFLVALTSQAATWAQGGGGGESDVNERVYIDLTSNQQGDTSLIGIPVTVVTAGGDTLLDTTWQGEQLFCRVAPLTEYTVSVGTLDGYKVDNPERTYESVISGVREITFDYATTIVTFLPTSNQGAGDTTIEQATGTINGETVTYGQSKKVVPGTEVTVAANALTNYLAPARYVATAEGASMTPTMLYQTTIVTISWESNLGNDPVIAAVKATIAGREVSSGESLKVATGTTVSVAFPDVEGYRKPTIADFVAEGTAVTKPVVQYSTDVYSVVIDSNQTDKSDIENVKVTVNDGTTDKQLSDGDTIKIPSGTTPTATAPDVNGYRKTLTVGTDSKVITVQYDTTLVSVVATSNQGVSDPVLEGLKFSINGTEVSANVSVKVPTGSALTISAPDINRYSKTITAADTATGGSSIATVAYRTTRVSVNMVSSVAGVEGAAPQDAVATVSYQGGTDQTITNGQLASVPTGVSFTITYGTASGYGTPATYQGTAEGASMTAQKAVYVSGAVTVSLSMSDGDAAALALAGAKVAVDGGSPVDYTGSPIPIAPGSSVVVTFKAVEGYTTPANQEFTMPASAYTVSAIYSTSVFSVNVTSNQTGDTGITSQKVSVIYDGLATPKEVGNGQTIKVPLGLTPTATAPDVTGYAKEVTVIPASRIITAAYQTTLVSVNMVGVNAGTEGDAPAGAQATVKYQGGADQVLTDNTMTAKVPTGTAFTIEYANVQNYGTPATYSATASGASMTAPKAQYVYGVLNVEVSMSDNDNTDLADVTAQIAVNGGAATAMTGTVDTTNHKKTFTTTLNVGDEYEITFGSVEGYATPASITGEKGSGVETKAVEYETDIYTVAVTSNQTSDTDITALQVSVSYTGLAEAKNIANGGTIKVPLGLTPTATAPDVTGYAKDVTVNTTAKTITAAYQTTLVSVNMVGVNAGTEGDAPAGAQATVKYQGGADQVLTDNTMTAKVPTGTAFTIDYAAVNSYATPVTYSATASGASMTAPKAQYVYGVLNVEVSMSDNDNTDLAGVTAQIAVNGGAATAMTGTVDTTNHKKTFTTTLNVGDEYEITFGSVEGYATPASITGEKGSGVETKAAEYETNIYTLTVTGQNRDETIEYTQDGQTVSKTLSSGNSVKVPAGIAPTVASAYVKGYARSVSVGTVTSHAATITVAYSATPVSVTIVSNQTGDTTISALRATVSWTYDGHDESETGVASGDTVNVPTGVTPTITFPEAPAGYSRSVSGNTATYSTEKVTVSVSADEGTPDLSGAAVTVTDTTASKAVSKTGSVYLIPSGHQFSVSVSGDVDGYTTPDAQAGLTASSAAGAARTVEMVYVYNPIMYAYVKIDQSQSGDTAMITVSDTEGGAKLTCPTTSSAKHPNAAIQAIRDASHLYMGTFANGKMTLKQLQDGDGTKYLDGTTAKMDGTDGDHYLRIGVDFYIKRVSGTDSGNQVTYGIAVGGQPDSSWKQIVSPNDLLGVHEAYISGTSLYSRSGIQSGANQTRDTFKTYARNRGTGFQLVTWEWHCVMALLFYAWYGRTNCQAQCGTGADSYTRTLGTKDSLGMTDTTSSNGNADNTKFWGLENWWGDKYEWIDNVDVNNRVWTIKDINGTTKRTNLTAGSSDGWITKLMLSENLDLIPTAASGGSDTTYYCDYYYQNSGSRVVARSNCYASPDGGVASVYANYDSSSAYDAVGSRLAFSGNIEIA